MDHVRIDRNIVGTGRKLYKYTIGHTCRSTVHHGLYKGEGRLCHRVNVHCTKNPIYVFQKMKLRGLIPNSYIHVQYL
jgi:hypothetical protein